MAFRIGWDAPLLAFLVLGLLSYAISPYRFSTQLELVKYFAYAAYFYSFVALSRGGEPLRWVFGSIFLSGLLQCAVILYQLLVKGVVRPSGTFFDPNYAAGWIFLALLTAMWKVLRDGWRGWRTISLIVVSGLMVLCIIATGSRSVFALLVISAAVLLFVLPGKVKYIPVVIALIALMVPNPARDRLLGLSGLDQYAWERANIWKATALIIKDHPLVGVTLGNLPDHTYPYNFPVDENPARYSRRFKKAHNSLLQISAEMGIPAALAIIAWLVRWAVGWAGVWRGTSSQSGRIDLAFIGLIVLSFGIQGMLTDNISSPPMMLAFVSMVAMVRAKEEKGKKKEPTQHEDLSRGRLEVVWRELKGSSFVAAFLGLVMALILWPVFVLNPFLAWMSFSKAQDQASAGRITLAEKLVKKAIRWNPAQPYFWGFLGEIQMLMARELNDSRLLAQAYSYLNRASSLNPRDPMLYEKLARFCMEAHRQEGEKRPTWLKNARYFYEEAIKRNPLNPFYRYQLASVLWELGNLQRASEQLEAAVELEPNFIMAHKALASLYKTLKRPQLASHHQRRAEFIQRQYQDWKPKNDYERELFRPSPQKLSKWRDS